MFRFKKIDLEDLKTTIQLFSRKTNIPYIWINNRKLKILEEQIHKLNKK